MTQAIAHGSADGVIERLPLSVRMGWGIGTLGPVTVLTATNVVLLRYMTDFVGISAGVAASLIAFSKIFDAFADPTMGVVSDRTRSRWGRRRPYLVLGGVMLAIAVVGLFAVPDFGAVATRVWYVGFLLLFYAVAYTVFNIPYMAMPAEMTSNYLERSNLMSFRVYAVGASQIVASVFGPMLLGAFGGGAGAYRIMALVFVPIILGSAWTCFRLTRDAPSTERARDVVQAPLGERVRSVLSNRPFMVLILVKFLTLMALGVQSVYAFFFAHVLGLSDGYLGQFFLVSSLALIISQPGWLWLLRKLGEKRNVYIIALLLSIPAYLSWLAAGPSEPAMLIYLRAAVIGVAGGGAILMGQSLLPDTMEYDYRRTGLRREGIFAGFYTTVEKLSGAIGVAAVGAILSGAGYVAAHGSVAQQPASAIHAIYQIMGFVPAIISTLGVIALLFYNLSEAKLKATVHLPRAGEPVPGAVT